jgi:uncharacterized protein YcbX
LKRRSEASQREREVTSLHRIGTIAALYRYPVKSMAGEQLEEASLGWYGVDGDRRFALRRLGDTSGFPWLTATRYPTLLQFNPVDGNSMTSGALPHIRTPNGAEFDLFDPRLVSLIRHAAGIEVEMMRLKQGVFDEAPVSVLALRTAEAICSVSEVRLDVRRFRPNILLDAAGAAFVEDNWISKTLVIGIGDAALRIAVTMSDKRCSMINLDPDTAESQPAVLKAAVKLNDNCAGVYGSVTRCGSIRVGDPVFLD